MTLRSKGHLHCFCRSEIHSWHVPVVSPAPCEPGTQYHNSSLDEFITRSYKLLVTASVLVYYICSGTHDTGNYLVWDQMIYFVHFLITDYIIIAVAISLHWSHPANQLIFSSGFNFTLYDKFVVYSISQLISTSFSSL